jgi:glycerol-3-phosphate dehydrogenase (NAD(P)+)
LPAHPLPRSIHVLALADLPLTAINPSCVVAVLCVPSSALESLVSQHAFWLAKCQQIIIAAKGILSDPLQFAHRVVNRSLGNNPHQRDRIGLISGPSFAQELAQCLPTAITLAHPHIKTAQDLCGHWQRDHLRLYPSDDLTGVAVAGALKNVLAVASGLSDGMGLGANARAALITRGLHEIATILEDWGGQRETLYGLAGIGDILLTCMGNLSRNRQAGLALARGESITSIRQRLGTVEGLNTALVAEAWIHQRQLAAPIIQTVASIIRGTISSEDAVKLLMLRPLKTHEMAR